MSKEVAWVGWEGSLHDWEIFSKIHEFIPTDSCDDIINLRDGRDFLEEDKVYYMVVLCYIFCSVTPSSDLRKTRLMVNGGKWCISHLSTIENWRRRLLLTQAKMIIAWGGSNEVGYSYVGELPGYVLTVNPIFSQWNSC